MTNTPFTSTTYKVPHMDCASEEQLVRMKLADRESVQRLAFDLSARTVVVTHTGTSADIDQAMQELNLGAAVVGREQIAELEPDASDEQQRTLLVIVLLINAALFILELTTGLIARSMGLVADSLDMLADALVYGLSLYAVGKAVAHKQRVARMSGYFQLSLAVFGVAEVVRRFVGTSEAPNFMLMITMSLLALGGNVAALVVLHRSRSRDVHMQASWIFTSNDVLVNLGVIVAGVLVFLSSSQLPDLVIGAAVFCIVGSGAIRILRLSR